MPTKYIFAIVFVILSPLMLLSYGLRVELPGETATTLTAADTAPQLPPDDSSAAMAIRDTIERLDAAVADHRADCEICQDGQACVVLDSIRRGNYGSKKDQTEIDGDSALRPDSVPGLLLDPDKGGE